MGEYPAMQLIPEAVTKRAGALGTTAQNVLEVARFGGLETGEEPAPYEVVARGRVYRLRHYFADEADGADPPLLLVPPLMLSAEVYDVSPDVSAVRDLHALGRRPVAGRLRRAREARRAGWSARSTITSARVSEAIDHVRAATGARRPPRRLLAGRHVLLPGGGVPAKRGPRER